MEHIELVTVSSEADSDDDQEIDNEQENFIPLIQVGPQDQTCVRFFKTISEDILKMFWGKLCFVVMCLASPSSA